MPLTIRVPLLLGSISRQIYKAYVCIPTHAYIYNSTAGSVPSVYIPSSGLAGSKGKYVYRFLGISLQRNYTQFAFSSSCMKALAFPQSHQLLKHAFFFFFFSFIFISWRLITSQHFSGFCHTLTWISHGVTCIPHPDLPSHLPLHPIPLGLPSAPGPSTCLMHPAWAGDLFHYR